MINETVSIITPVYNSEEFLRETIDSVIAQTYQNWEHILVDDCSTDKSASIIKEYANKDSRIRYFKLTENSGAGLARNKAIEIAKGRYIAFLDSDDLWLSEKLEIQLQFMQSKNVVFSFSSYLQIDEHGEEVRKKVLANAHITYNRALKYNPVGCLTAIYDSKILGKCFMPLIRKRQDFALWLKILKRVDGYGIMTPLAYYRLRRDSISSNKLNLIKYQWELYRHIEKLSFGKSVYYLLTSIIHSLMK